MPICISCKTHFSDENDLARHTCGEPLKPLTKKEQATAKKEANNSQILNILQGNK